jgi:hypothetical protein
MAGSEVMGRGTAEDDVATVCAISVVAGILGDVTHEGLGHAMVALLTGAQSGVLSTVAWSSAYDSRLVAAGGTLANLLLAGVLWVALRRVKNATAATRFFLFASCAFNLLTGTGYFLFSGVSDFGDWAVVIAGLNPHWLWRGLLIAVGAGSYYWAMRVLGTSLIRDVGVPRTDAKRLQRLTLVPYFCGIVLAVAAALPNPLGFKLVLVSALPASAGGNCALIWLRYYARRGTVPAHGPAAIERSLSWLAGAAVLSLAFIFILGRGVPLHL